jgi:hypothetical protein
VARLQPGFTSAGPAAVVRSARCVSATSARWSSRPRSSAVRQAATGHDRGGHLLADRLEVMAAPARAIFSRLRPEAKDWNQPLYRASAKVHYVTAWTLAVCSRRRTRPLSLKETECLYSLTS